MSGEQDAQTGSIAKDAAAGVAARIVATLASGVTALLVVSALQKHEYGAYALAAGLVGVLAVALDAGTTSSLARYVAQGRGSALLVRDIAFLRVLILVAGAAILVLIGASGIAGNGFGALLIPASPLLISLGAVSWLYGSLPAMRRIRLFLVVTVLQPVLELIAMAIVLRSGGSAAWVLLASAIAGAVTCVVGYGALALTPGKIIPPVLTREAKASVTDVFAYGRQLFLVLLLMMVFGQLDQFVISGFHGDAAVAPYALAIKLQAFLIAPAVAATSIVAPRIAGAGVMALGVYRIWMAVFVVLHAGVVVVCAVLAPQFFTAINPEYANDWGIFVAMLPFIFLSAIATLSSVTLNQVGHARSRLKMASIAIIINVVLDFSLVPSLGAYGAAIGTTTAFAYYAWAHHHRLDQELRLLGEAPVLWRKVMAVGTAFALLMGAVAVLIRPLAEQIAGGERASAIAVVLLAGGVPAVIHVLFTLRLARQTMR